MHAQYDTAAIRSRHNLLDIADRHRTLKWVARTNGGEWAGPCPLCGGEDRFRVQPSAQGGGLWMCRKCTDAKWQDVIDFVMRRDNVSFLAACAGLEGPTSNAFRPDVPRPRPVRAVHTSAPAPAAEWQGQAGCVIATCQQFLWSAAGQRARAWLRDRGLTEQTLQRWKIGYNPSTPSGWRRLHNLVVPCGIVIPGQVGTTIWYLKVRQAVGKPKYRQVKGSRPALAMADTLKGQRVVVLTEGEFDALLLWQEAGDLTGVATLGSAQATLDLSIWGKHLEAAEQIFIAYDADAEGQAGARKLRQTLPFALVLKGPTAVPGGKDLTDYHMAGGQLRDWMSFAVARYGWAPDRQCIR